MDSLSQLALQAQVQYQERPDRLALACAIFPAMYTETTAVMNKEGFLPDWREQFCYEVWKMADVMLNMRHVSN